MEKEKMAKDDLLTCSLTQQVKSIQMCTLFLPLTNFGFGFQIDFFFEVFCACVAATRG